MAIRSLTVNGKRVPVTYNDPQTPLLYVLRNDLGLRGPRFGCGLGQCGACTVHIDGAAVRSCITPLSTVDVNKKIVTLEGLGTPEKAAPGAEGLYRRARPRNAATASTE
jgi:nicotinate dehydrogenase subunit A